MTQPDQTKTQPKNSQSQTKGVIEPLLSENKQNKRRLLLKTQITTRLLNYKEDQKLHNKSDIETVGSRLHVEKDDPIEETPDGRKQLNRGTIDTHKANGGNTILQEC